MFSGESANAKNSLEKSLKVPKG